MLELARLAVGHFPRDFPGGRSFPRNLRRSVVFQEISQAVGVTVLELGFKFEYIYDHICRSGTKVSTSSPLSCMHHIVFEGAGEAEMGAKTKFYDSRAYAWTTAVPGVPFGKASQLCSNSQGVFPLARRYGF